MKNFKRLVSLILVFSCMLTLFSCKKTEHTENKLESKGIYISGELNELVDEEVELTEGYIAEKFPGLECDIIEIRSTVTNIRASAVENEDEKEIVHIYGIDPKYKSYIGLPNHEMEDGTAYFTENPLIRPHIQIDVITDVNKIGTTSDHLVWIDMDTAIVTDKNVIFNCLEEKYFTPSMVLDKVGFVTLDTFDEITENSCTEEVATNEDFEAYNIVALCIFCDNHQEVAEFLGENYYSVDYIY